MSSPNVQKNHFHAESKKKAWVAPTTTNSFHFCTLKNQIFTDQGFCFMQVNSMLFELRVREQQDSAFRICVVVTYPQQEALNLNQKLKGKLKKAMAGRQLYMLKVTSTCWKHGFRVRYSVPHSPLSSIRYGLQMKITTRNLIKRQYLLKNIYQSFSASYLKHMRE